MSHQHLKKTQIKNKSDIENEGNTICRISAEQDQPNKNPKSKRDQVKVLGDSIIKHRNGWEIAKTLKPECKVFVRNFPGATTQCMGDYTKSSIQAKPNRFILHVGSNGLNWNRPPDEIAKAAIDLASELKSEKSSVSISSIIMTADKLEIKWIKREVKSTIIWKKCVTERTITLLITAKTLKQVIWIVVGFI